MLLLSLSLHWAECSDHFEWQWKWMKSQLIHDWRRGPFEGSILRGLSLIEYCMRCGFMGHRFCEVKISQLPTF